MMFVLRIFLLKSKCEVFTVYYNNYERERLWFCGQNGQYVRTKKKTGKIRIDILCMDVNKFIRGFSYDGKKGQTMRK